MSRKKLLNQLSNTIRTTEIVEEYSKLKNKQDAIKNVSGFVGGLIFLKTFVLTIIQEFNKKTKLIWLGKRNQFVA